MTEPKGKYIEANGINIYYETYGEGPPLVLLHGAYGNVHVQWKDHIQAYAQHFKVYALDARAHGKTKNPSGEMTGELLLQDVLAFIEVMELDRPFISGWSMGAAVALHIAIRYTGSARAYVIGGASHKLKDEEERLQQVKEIGFLGPGEVDFERYKNNFPLYDLIKNDYGPDFEALVYSISHLVYDRPPEHSKEDIQKADVPVLLIMGDRDYNTTVEDITELYRMLPNTQLAIIPGADHSMCRTKPEIYSQLVIDFLLQQNKSTSLE